MHKNSVAIYIVLHIRDTWWVDFEGRCHGPYESKEAAAAEAADLAQYTALHVGRRSEVRVPDDSGHYWAVWQSRDYETAARGAGPLADAVNEVVFPA
jgi:hypothetical protein